MIKSFLSLSSDFILGNDWWIQCFEILMNVTEHLIYVFSQFFVNIVQNAEDSECSVSSSTGKIVSDDRSTSREAVKLAPLPCSLLRGHWTSILSLALWDFD